MPHGIVQPPGVLHLVGEVDVRVCVCVWGGGGACGGVGVWGCGGVCVSVGGWVGGWVGGCLCGGVCVCVCVCVVGVGGFGCVCMVHHTYMCVLYKHSVYIFPTHHASLVT